MTPDPQLDKACEHEDFKCSVEIHRLVDTDGGPIVAYMADLEIRCQVCNEPFRFNGVMAGSSGARPMCSVDETTLHIPIRPASADPDFGLGIPGYAVQVVTE